MSIRGNLECLKGRRMLPNRPRQYYKLPSPNAIYAMQTNFCRIQSDGSQIPCSRLKADGSSARALKRGFDVAYLPLFCCTQNAKRHCPSRGRNKQSVCHVSWLLSSPRLVTLGSGPCFLELFSVVPIAMLIPVDVFELIILSKGQFYVSTIPSTSAQGSQLELKRSAVSPAWTSFLSPSRILSDFTSKLTL